MKSGLEKKDVLESPIEETETRQPDERYALLKHKVAELEVEKIWREFEDAGFAPILIKGWAAAKLYPKPYVRSFTDVDLIVSPDCYDDALKFSFGLKNHLPVDLHCGARHLDKLSFEELFSDSLLVDCGRTKIRVPRHEDHLRILCVHWLTDGGADRERLWDIYYGVVNRPEDFDWVRFLDAAGARRRRWLICALGLTEKYLGLDLSGSPVGKETQDLPVWLVRAVEREWASGVRLLPLNFFLNDKKLLWKQIKKRLPPNPIQATIDLEGDFDDKPRIGYQLRDIFLRIKPSVKRIGQTLRRLASSRSA